MKNYVAKLRENEEKGFSLVELMCALRRTSPMGESP